MFLIFRHSYWRTDAPYANRGGGPNKKKNYWRTVPGLCCLLAEGDIGAPIYWRTDPPVHRVDRVLGFLSSRLNLDPNHLTCRWVCPPLCARGGHTCLQERGWVGPQYWQTDKKKRRTEHFAAPRLFSSQSPINWALQTETEILWRKNDSNINKQTDIDRHTPVPSLKSSQPPDPPHFSLPTTFNMKIHFNFLDFVIPWSAV